MGVQCCAVVTAAFTSPLHALVWVCVCVCVFTSIKCVSVGHCVSVCMCVCERAHPGVYTCGAALPVASTSVASTK